MCMDVEIKTTFSLTHLHLIQLSSHTDGVSIVDAGKGSSLF